MSCAWAALPLRLRFGMRSVEVKRRMGEDDLTTITALLVLAARADGHHPLGEHKWLDLVQGGRHGFLGLVAREPEHPHPVGYAQLSRGTDSWGLEIVVHPHHRSADGSVTADLLRAALAAVGATGGGHLHWWVPKPTPTHDAIAAAAGLDRGRDLLQLRRSLPAPPPPLPRLSLRAFRRGEDEEAWLEVNNRAFSWHPEQGGWDLETLRAREREPWFDPEGFLLLEHEGKLEGFCWTKVHAAEDPPLGEIYVIAVDPVAQGSGLGRALVLEGLDHLARQGLTVGMLYVDASNTPARRLYDSLGFAIDHVDRAYTTDVAPTAPAA